MKKKIAIVLGALLVVVLAAIVSCPDKKAHEDAVADEMKEVVNSALKESTGNDASDTFINSLGSILLNGISETLIANQLQYKNYFVVSTSQLQFKGEKKTLSVGLFGHVFTTFSAEDISQKLKEESIF